MVQSFEYTNKRGQTYWLHSRKGKGGAMLYFFSKKSEKSIDLPSRFKVIENKRTGLPMVKRK